MTEADKRAWNKATEELAEAARKTPPRSLDAYSRGEASTGKTTAQTNIRLTHECRDMLRQLGAAWAAEFDLPAALPLSTVIERLARQATRKLEGLDDDDGR